MEIMKDLFNGKGYIDGITIIDITGEILFTAKFNNKLNSQADQNYEVVGKKFLDMYEGLDEHSSSTYKSMELGAPLYVANQSLKAIGKNPISISSLSIPIKSGSRIVGAIDLSTSCNVEEQRALEEDPLEMDINLFDNNNVGKIDISTNQAVYTKSSIITKNKKMLELKEYIDIAARYDLPTIIYGETGTGKELFAQAIHNVSQRKNKQFVAQNCAAIPDNLLESILFGTTKGAFTGATDNKGLLELAEGGTLFLDEINSMSLHLQSKLLRVLQDGILRRVGSGQTKKIDVKIIAAINEEATKAIENGTLRRDIYYRLSTFKFDIPPLRERTDDIPILVKYMVAKYNKIFHKSVKCISNELYDQLIQYDWPGNIRELENIIVYGMSTISGQKEKLCFSDIEQRYYEIIHLNTKEIRTVHSLKESMENYERQIIKGALMSTEFNISKASKLLGIPRQTLQRKVKNYEMI